MLTTKTRERLVTFFEVISAILLAYATFFADKESDLKEDSKKISDYRNFIMNLDAKVDCYDEGVLSYYSQLKMDSSEEIQKILIDLMYKYCVNLGSMQHNLMDLMKIDKENFAEDKWQESMNGLHDFKNRLDTLYYNRHRSIPFAFNGIADHYFYLKDSVTPKLNIGIDRIKYLDDKIDTKKKISGSEYKNINRIGVGCLLFVLLLKFAGSFSRSRENNS
ncbi:MAG: hypothetical protein ABI675_07365 [Chitinophagaceae bacterium]